MASTNGLPISDRLRYVIQYPLFGLSKEVPPVDPAIAQRIRLKFEEIQIAIVQLEDELRSHGL